MTVPKLSGPSILHVTLQRLRIAHRALEPNVWGTTEFLLMHGHKMRFATPGGSLEVKTP